MVCEAGVILEERVDDTMDEMHACNVQVEIETAAEIVIDSVDGDVKDVARRWSSGCHQREERLALTTEANLHGTFVAAHALAEHLVLDDDAYG